MSPFEKNLDFGFFTNYCYLCVVYYVSYDRIDALKFSRYPPPTRPPHQLPFKRAYAITTTPSAKNRYHLAVIAESFKTVCVLHRGYAFVFILLHNERNETKNSLI